MGLRIKRDATAARDEAMARVEVNADQHWKDMAIHAVFKLALTGRKFTTDDVWAKLAEWKVPPPHEPRAMGPIMRNAVKLGWITSDGEYRQSSSAVCHARPMKVYYGA